MKKLELLDIPNIGVAIKKDLESIGITSVEMLKTSNPDDLYDRVCKMKGFKEDRCLLYVFRMAIYYVNNENHDKEKLKWWYWKDDK